MSLYHTRPHVEDIRKMKERGEKISMLSDATRDEAAANWRPEFKTLFNLI